MRTIIATAVAAAAFVAGAADATTYVASFTAGPVTDVYRPPYGADVGTVFTGSLRYDSDAQKLTSFTFNAPTRTFTLADVDMQQVMVGPTEINYFFVRFVGGLISSNNTASVSQETPVSGFAYCNNCVGFTSSVAPAGVPEPATWGLMILGFAGIATAMRRQRAVLRAA